MEAWSGMEPGRASPSGIAFDFPVGEEGSPTGVGYRVPKRIRRRLMESSRANAPSTAEDIDARLRDAHLRRQQFHAWLSSKARPKPRSPSWSSQEEDPGQRLEAKLYAAEQKRLSLLAKAQMRLARLDELRQAAKTSVELRLEKEREKLGTKVESRVQQAEANRMLLLKTIMQRRVATQERTARSLLQRINKEAKYKERVRMAISQKRAAAEKKRLGLLEAEKTRARARVMQAHRIAKSVCFQREIERRKMKEQLEDRLQRARWQRAEYLKHRGGSHSSTRVNGKKLYRQGDILSRKLARCWRQFVRSKCTTLALVKKFQALDISENSVPTMRFEQLAGRIQSSTTIQIVKSLLDRLESRLMLSQRSGLSQPDSIDHLLKRVSSPGRRGSSGKIAQARGHQLRKDRKELRRHETRKLSRYPVRVVLCAYMILGHPDAVFSGHGNCEKELTDSAVNFIRELELLIKVILDGPCGIMSDEQDSSSQSPTRHTFRSQLAAFDTAWCSYLYRFAVWKVKDAKLLEEDLVRAACQLELSMMQTCKVTSDGQSPDLTHDMRAIQKQVTEDQKLLREKVRHITGSAGIERMESALSDARSKFFEAKESGSSPMTPIAHISSPLLPTSASDLSDAPSDRRLQKSEGRPNSVVRSLFNDNGIDQSIANMKVQGTSPMENELLVSEILHDPHGSFIESLGSSHEDENTFKANVKRTMEKAFWDEVMESLTQDNPDYKRIVMLVTEVRDELREMAPQVLKQEIKDHIDIDILTQLLDSRSVDLDYLGKIFEYSLGTLEKLSAPAKEAEMKKAHQNMLQELAEITSDGEQRGSFVAAVVKGLRFVLEEVKELKREISKARIQMMVPIIRSPAGFEYLQKAFADCYGSPSMAASKLPLAKQWLLSLGSSDVEWREHVEFLSTLGTSQCLPTATALRSGGKTLLSLSSSQASSSITNTGFDECKGERLDVMLRIGLLKLVMDAEGLIEEALPEMLNLNFLRLRNVQGNLQKIIVISTSMLVLRQFLLNEKIITKSADIEDKISGCVKSLWTLLERGPDVGVVEIIDTITSSCMEEKPGENKELMARVLVRSLQAGDAVFEKVSQSLYLATRSLVLCGTGVRGRGLAEIALRRVGVPMLLDQVVVVAETLIMVAKISGQVHRSWYESLLQN